MKEKKDKGIYAYRVRYLFLFHFGRINAKGKRLIAASFRPLSNGCVLIIPQGITFITHVRNRTKIYHSQPLAFHLAPAGETLPLKTILLYEQRSLYRGWLCRPLIVFCVTVFPSFCGTLGQGSACYLAATKNAVQRRKAYSKDPLTSGLKDSGVTPPPFPSHRAASRHLGAAQSHRSRCARPKVRFWTASIYISLSLCNSFNSKSASWFLRNFKG